MEMLCVLVDPGLSWDFTGTLRDFFNVLLAVGIAATPSSCTNSIFCCALLLGRVPAQIFILKLPLVAVRRAALREPRVEWEPNSKALGLIQGNAAQSGGTDPALSQAV